MSNQVDFRLTWLWRHAFVNPLSDVTEEEQHFFRDSFLAMREKVEVLVSKISDAIPELTVHDISHLDALWETASLVSEGAITVSPAEAFVFGASVLLHDSAMSLSAYPKGLEDLNKTIEWKDTVTALFGTPPIDPNMIDYPPLEISKKAVPMVLRQLHAKQSENLASQGWTSENGDVIHLIEDHELRFFYGESIGKIAHSHWWSLSKIEEHLSENLGALPIKTKSIIDKIKIACLIRIADALHIDQRRAPRFLRALSKPSGDSKLHWIFQERIAAPHIEHESIVFTSGAPFSISDADAWWLAYDTVSDIDRELREVDLLLQNRGKVLYLKARRVRGAGSPESLARTIQTKDWRPVDTQFRVSDIPKVVETLGGAKLYGDDPAIALRELIQNSADAIQARRRYQKREEGWGSLLVSLTESPDGHWLSVEDNGIGMSEQVLTGPLIDFGTSFWKSTLATQEFPGLVSSGMNAIGRYGIGFFSVFMVGSRVRVISRRHDQSETSARLLEFRDGTASRPILSPVDHGIAPIDGGTRVEILLRKDPNLAGGLLHSNDYNGSVLTLKQLVASLAPSIDVSISVLENGAKSIVVDAKDWLEISDAKLMARLDPLEKMKALMASKVKNRNDAIRPIFDRDGKPLGRARIRPKFSYYPDGGWVTIGGLRSSRLSNVQGLLVGETLTASRNSAIPLLDKEILKEWASEQARLIAKTNTDDQLKAKCAEVVLECGGDIGDLPVACIGCADWLNSQRLRQLLLDLDEFIVSF